LEHLDWEENQPLPYETSSSSDGFMYMWHHLIMFWLSLILFIDDKSSFLVN
jgi:hypothetical protein